MSKPRLRKNANNWWVCFVPKQEYLSGVGHGDTALDAYEAWLLKQQPSCRNCTSTQPGVVDIKCGMCCGPYSSPPNNKYERITFVPRHNSATLTQVPGTVRPTRTVGAKDSLAAPYGRATI